MLEQFFSKLGASTRITVGVSISPNIGVEMIEVDRATGTVNKYGSKPLEYNHSTREITDFAGFQMALESLFEELHIPKNSNIILSIPNVHFGLITLPLLLTDEAITNAVISEVEQSYIFKRQEPIVGWTEILSNIDTENRCIAYSAIQKNVLEGIKEACSELGCSVVGVENSYTSLLRALNYTNLASAQMHENVTWNLMVIGQNSYSIISMLDKKVIEYYEEPLALKSFEDDEIYNAIITSAKLTLASLPANYLYIVSETDLVSAEVLSLKLNIDSTVQFLECNKYTQNEILPVNLNILPNMAMKITPEAVGVAVSIFSEFPLKLNFVADNEGGSATAMMPDEEYRYPRINIGNVEVEITPDFIKKVVMILGLAIALPLFGLFLLLNNYALPQQQAKLADLNAKIDKTNTEIKQYTDANKNNAFNLNSTIQKIATDNENKLAYYSAMGMSVTKKLWITYYQANEAGNVDIKGKSNDVQSVYAFYKSVKQLINDSNIRLYRLEIASDSIDAVIAGSSGGPRSYDFEITNMTDTELNPPVPSTGPDGKSTEGATDANQTQNKLFEFGKSIFGTKDKSTTGNPTPETPGSSPSASPPTAPPTEPPSDRNESPMRPTPPAPRSSAPPLTPISEPGGGLQKVKM